MSFRSRREEKQERDAVAQAELDRLLALGPEALAVELLPVLGELKGSFGGVSEQQICKELLHGFTGSMKVNTFGLRIPVKEALQRLEHANLVMRMAGAVDRSVMWRITSTGEKALSVGDWSATIGAPPA